MTDFHLKDNELDEVLNRLEDAEENATSHARQARKVGDSDLAEGWARIAQTYGALATYVEEHNVTP